MLNKKFGVLLLLMVLSIFGAKAQLTTSVRFNEVLVVNEDNFVDDYGKRHPWFELYNNSAGTVDLRGCFLTDDKSNPRKYMIPKGDVLTKVPPYQHVLFWADNKPTRGTFHVNFTLDPTKDNYIALYDADGTTLIDEVKVPAGQVADISYAREMDGTGKWISMTKVTPSTNNVTLDTNEKVENFQRNDSWGIGMTITAIWCSSRQVMLQSAPASVMPRRLLPNLARLFLLTQARKTEKYWLLSLQRCMK